MVPVSENSINSAVKAIPLVSTPVSIFSRMIEKSA